MLIYLEYTILELIYQPKTRQIRNIYIKEHNLSYTPPPYKVWKSLKSQAKNKSAEKFKEPLEKFKEMFEENKRKRTIKELEDAYY